MPLYAIAGSRPRIHPTAWIAPSAELIGDVVVGEGASVWFGAVIRGDNTTITIGARSNVQEGAMLHSDPGAALAIGAEVTVGHHAILHGCTIGSRVLIGMGATVLNRAAIGDACLVGARALVTEGKTFDGGQLIVGSPARATRALDDAELGGLALSAAHYADRARAYATGLTRLD